MRGLIIRLSHWAADAITDATNSRAGVERSMPRCSATTFQPSRCARDDFAKSSSEQVRRSSFDC